MDIVDIRNALHELIEVIDDDKLKAIYKILEPEIIENEEVESGDHWQDKDFVAEMNRRYNDYKKGTVNLVSLDEVENKARQAAQILKHRKAS